MMRALHRMFAGTQNFLVLRAGDDYWCDKRGAGFAHRVKAARRTTGSTRLRSETFVTPRSEPYLLWRAVDEYIAHL
jgi:hypothetical protein